MTPAATTIFTIGHSTRSIEDFVGLLWTWGVSCLADVRSVPRSRHNPQFDRENLPASVEAAGIRYLHLPELGGLRKPRPDSPNTGWRHSGFRGYADYMQTPGFEQAMKGLLKLAEGERLCLMCAEAVPWRCHRSLLSDALLVRSVDVEHILSETKLQTHRLTSFARVKGTAITYPAESNLFC